MKQLNRSIRIRLLLAGLLLLACALAAIGVATARYQTKLERTASIVPGPAAEPELAMTDNWTPTAERDGYSAAFEIRNYDTSSMPIRLYLLVSQGLGSSGNAVVTFTVNGETYSDSIEAYSITADSPRYDSFGSGWVFQSFDGSSPRSWTVPARATGNDEPGKLTGTVTIRYDTSLTVSDSVLVRLAVQKAEG